MPFSLHVEAMGWLRFGKRLPYVATEAGKFNADVLGADDNQLIEVEVKKSKSDLKRDFETKTWKHMIYNDPGAVAPAWVPNQFYFLVPEELGDWAKSELESHMSPAGVLVLAKSSFSNGFVPRGNLHALRRSKTLHKGPPSKLVLNHLAQRMANELTGLRLILEHQLTPTLIRQQDSATVQMLLGAIKNLSQTPDWETVDEAKHAQIPPDDGHRPGKDDSDGGGVRAGDNPGALREVQAPPNCS